MADIVVAHCPQCGDLRRCEGIRDGLTIEYRCTECNRKWREEVW